MCLLVHLLAFQNSTAIHGFMNMLSSTASTEQLKLTALLYTALVLNINNSGACSLETVTL
jgi:hypothetical protein